jgi:hypothetical protein
VSLKAIFGRDVVFEYECGGAIVRVEREGDFSVCLDQACQSGNTLDVVIVKAKWNSLTEFYTSQGSGKKRGKEKQWWEGDV